ncbi:MAG: hypothetical protein P3W94_003005, partial [Paracoccus sp. (in: a-proteobacteria)]|nr:hypothetical protein [Paracoccus sp. (in: a-proteobacteria)]
MTRIALRFATICRAACAAMLAATPITATASMPVPPASDPAPQSTHGTTSSVEGWPAMADASLAEILAKLDDLPLSGQATHDQPYCASDDEIAMTLRHDFAEEVVLTA